MITPIAQADSIDPIIREDVFGRDDLVDVGHPVCKSVISSSARGIFPAAMTALVARPQPVHRQASRFFEEPFSDFISGKIKLPLARKRAKGE